MGRWKDKDNWEGDRDVDEFAGQDWKSRVLGGNYDNRYRGVKNYGRNSRRSKTKSVTVGIVFLIIIGVFGFVLFDQGYLDETIKQAPQEIQDATESAKEIVTEVTEKAKEIVDETTEKATEIINEQTDTVSKKINEIQEGIPIVDLPETSEKEKLAEEEIHRLVNIERMKQGLSALSYDTKLAGVAKLHSVDMYERSYFEHDTPEGKDPTDRATSVGYQCQKRVGNLIYSGVAENIFMFEGASLSFWESPESIAIDAVSGWMDSPGHRENILTGMYDREGIGVKIGSFDVYVTQNFC